MYDEDHLAIYHMFQNPSKMIAFVLLAARVNGT